MVTRETEEAVSIAASAGIKLETTYTGKAFAAMVADGRRGELRRAQVLFWDTYNSAPMPEPGDIAELPQVLRDYVAGCDSMFAAEKESDR